MALTILLLECVGTEEVALEADLHRQPPALPMGRTWVLGSAAVLESLDSADGAADYVPLQPHVVAQLNADSSLQNTPAS